MPPPAARTAGAPRIDLPVKADDLSAQKATPGPKRTVMRLFSDASAMAAPPVQALDGMFHSSVVIEASASPAMFSRTFIASKQRTKINPPSAPPTKWTEGELLRLGAVHHEGEPRCASSSSPRAVRVMSSSPLKDRPAGVVALVVEVTTTARPSTPTSVALTRKALARTFGTEPSSRRCRDNGAMAVEHGIAAARGRRVVDFTLVGVGPGDLVLAILRRGGVPGDDR